MILFSGMIEFNLFGIPFVSINFAIFRSEHLVIHVTPNSKEATKMRAKNIRGLPPKD